MDGKVILITGGSSGIGEGVAVELAAQGARIVSTGRNAQRGEAVAQRIRQAGGEAIFVAVDVEVEAEVRHAVSVATETFGRLDVAVNNAGIGPRGKLMTELANEAWNQSIGVDLTGVFFCMRH